MPITAHDTLLEIKKKRKKITGKRPFPHCEGGMPINNTAWLNGALCWGTGKGREGEEDEDGGKQGRERREKRQGRERWEGRKRRQERQRRERGRRCSKQPFLLWGQWPL